MPLGLALADSIDARAGEGPLGRTERSLAATVRARVAHEQSDAAATLAHLEKVRGQVPLELIMLYSRWPGYEYFYGFGQDHARYLRGVALHRSGEDDEALPWLRYGFTLTPGEIMYGPEVERIAGEIEARPGREPVGPGAPLRLRRDGPPATGGGP